MGPKAKLAAKAKATLQKERAHRSKSRLGGFSSTTTIADEHIAGGAGGAGGASGAGGIGGAGGVGRWRRRWRR